MKSQFTPQELFFEVDEAPVETVATTGEGSCRVTVPGKKALLRKNTRHVLGVVSRDYRVVTNQEAVKLALDVCGKAFPGLSPVEWEARRAAAPSTLSYAHIDLMHRTHSMNYWDNGLNKNDPYTPFVRVTNSFNGARALRFDIGFMRKHCSNGVIFEEAVATVRASHSKEALEKLDVEAAARDLPKMWAEFSAFLNKVRGIEMTPGQSTLALRAVLRIPEADPEDKPARREALHTLAADFAMRLTAYRSELGPNAYAVFNTLTDIAARPPENACFQKERDTIEKRSGRWLKDLAHQSQVAAFALDQWIPSWEAGVMGRKIPGRN